MVDADLAQALQPRLAVGRADARLSRGTELRLLCWTCGPWLFGAVATFSWGGGSALRSAYVLHWRRRFFRLLTLGVGVLRRSENRAGCDHFSPRVASGRANPPGLRFNHDPTHRTLPVGSESVPSSKACWRLAHGFFSLSSCDVRGRCGCCVRADLVNTMLLDRDHQHVLFLHQPGRAARRNWLQANSPLRRKKLRTRSSRAAPGTAA